MSHLHPVDKHLLFTKNDKEDPRLGECVQVQAKIQPEDIQNLQYDIAILGYPDDEGISLNGGRPGAQNAPKEVRHYFYKMSPDSGFRSLPRIADLGDLAAREVPLAARHEIGLQWTKVLAQKKIPWISLGGGHDYGYVDGAGFIAAHSGQAVILNFDAHMDVRPLTNGPNSGTSFFRLLSDFNGQFDFAEIGIQRHCNAKSHQQWAHDRGARIFPLEEVEERGLRSCLEDFLKGKEKKKIFLSLDIDAFSSTEAPGCSQSWTTGLKAREFLKTLEWLTLNFEVLALGIYEVSPPLDADHRTSKLAAQVLHRYLFSHLQKVQK